MEPELASINILSLIPFLLMLLSIAIFPLFWNHFWEKNKNKLLVAIVLSLPVIIYLLANGLSDKLIETLLFDYVPFIILLGTLFTITGGIYLSGDIEARPGINTLFLTTGAVLASFIGTTGAAMLLIRPIIQTNKQRKYKVHTILFFIGIVANCGGLLTPLGDPPLFMMYLRGAPFEWFFRLFPEWLFVNLLLLIIYYISDMYYHKKEDITSIAIDKSSIRPLKLEGKRNFIFLLIVILAVAFLNEEYVTVMHSNHYFKFIREAVIIFAGYLSILFTPRLLRISNNFTWMPIQEVAYLFLGIFVTMVPCLLYLEVNAKSFGITSATEFYYYTGLLSSFLDNTPTAVTFHSLALGLGANSANLIAGIREEILKAICIGAVYFGSMTYIGNGPNFMVKTVAEENNIKMPDFFSYILKFSLIILLPVFIIIQIIIL
ncbi:MAG: sodium:proton antiporter [Ignavibacteria bacterium]|nr:sodium:proton antiporter [Ignavibacteria bacterium]